MKGEVEQILGFELTEEQFQQSKARAERKLSRIISQYGDADGHRHQSVYLVELVYEDVISKLLSAATFFVADSVLHMEKEHSTNCQSALSDGRGHQNGLQDNPERPLTDQPMQLVFRCLE